MGITKSKICRVAAVAAAVVLAVSMQRDANDFASHADDAVGAPVRASGFGGVLVSKRMKMILGFVQTLPV